MSSAFDPIGAWERVATELRAARDLQQKAWGDVDNVTLGRYLAGELSVQEQGELEQVLDELPELRKLTDLVQDVLRDLELIEHQPLSVPEARPSPPVILPLQPRKRRRAATWVRRYGPLAAAACLFLVLGMLMPRPGFLAARRADERAGLGTAVAARFAPGTAVSREPLIFLNLPPAGQDDATAAAQPVPPAGTSADAPGGTGQPRAVASVRGEPQSRAQLQKVVNLCHARGDVEKAERTLRQAHRFWKEKRGPQHHNTQWTARQLAGVYQAALNTDEGTTRSVEPRVAPAVGVAQPRRAMDRRPDPYFRARTTARRVREQITSWPAQEVSTRVVPVLVQALRTSSCGKERQALVRALGELGPAAKLGVPVLMERLRKASDPGEQRAILHTLEQIGPGAREAVPVLLALSTSSPPRRANIAAKDSSTLESAHFSLGSDDWSCKLVGDEARLARKVLLCLLGAEGQVGVFDRAGLFSLRRVIDGTRNLRGVVRQHQIAIRIETVDSIGGCRPGLETLGRCAVQVFLDRKGRVQVHASGPLRDQGLNTRQLGEELEVLCRKNEYDRALGAILTHVKALEHGKQKN